MTITRHGQGPRMSACVIHGDTVYTAGIIAGDVNQGTEGQTRQILARIDQLLAEAGTDKSRLLRANVWLADISTFEEMNRVWDAWVDPANTPARATVEAKLARPDLKVEIMVIAAR